MSSSHEHERATSAANSTPDSSAAAEELYKKHLSRIFGYILYRVADRVVAEDLAADVFASVLKHIDGYDRSRGEMSTWIFAIARNKIRNHFRRERVRRLLFVTSVGQVSGEPRRSLEDSVIDGIALSEILRAVRELDPRGRELIGLKFGGGLSNIEIARLTGLSSSNVGVILHRTLKQLREKFLEGEAMVEANDV